MKRRRRMQPPVLGAESAVPRFRLARGDVELLDRPDPDSPNRTVRGARVVCHYDQLWRRRGLTDAEREAADRYAHTSEQAEGARDRSEGATGRTPPWRQGHPTLTQIQATTSLRFAHGAVGADGTALLRMYVRDNEVCEAIADRRREDRKVTMGRIRAALGRLAEHWGM